MVSITKGRAEAALNNLRAVVGSLARVAKRRRTALTLLAVAATVVCSTTPAAAERTVQPYRTDGQALNIRSQPTTNSAIVTTVPANSSFVAECHVSGQSVNGNDVWLQSRANGVRGYAADYYVNTSWRTRQDLTNQGIPPCGSGGGSSGGGGAASTADGDQVWIGKSFAGPSPDPAGCPGTYPSSTCSQPTSHWGVSGGQGDWSTDFVGGAGTPVKVYLAPRDGNVPVTAVVDSVTAGCRNGNGGSTVRVGVFVRGTRVGSVSFTHVNPSVSQGQSVNRWGGQIGTIGSYTPDPNCWTGTHLHQQAYAETGYACFARSLVQNPARNIGEHEWIGFVTGKYASGVRQVCP